MRPPLGNPCCSIDRRMSGLDWILFLADNCLMSTAETKETGIAAGEMAKLEYAAQMAASGQKDPAFAQRVAVEAVRSVKT